jgi:hypothetical protein
METRARNLPDWIDGFMLLTENSEPPMLYRKWCAISTIASALQRKCKLELGISLTIYPNFYIVLVGPSAAGKGTAMKYAYDIIEQVSAIRLSAQATSLQALIRRMKETNLTDVDVASGKQIFHSSLTIFSEEFTVFLGYHNRELMASLCDWYDCKNRWTYDTIKRDEEEVIGVWVNILGATTPDNIQSSLPLEAIGGGLTSRIIFVFEEQRDKLVVFPSATAREIELQHMLIKDLEQISFMGGNFRLTEDAAAAYSEWCYRAVANPPFKDKKFDGYVGRRRNHLLSLSMVCSASRSNDMVLKSEDIVRASQILNEVENKMALTFRGIGRSDISSLIGDAVTFFENSLTDEIPIWQFARHFECNMDKFTMDRVLATIQTSGYIHIVKKPGVGTVIVKKDDSKNEQSNHQPSSPDEP